MIEKSIRYDLQNLKKWFRSNELSLNVKKTNFMRFGSSKEEIKIKREGIKINEVKTTKFLGMMLDNKLCWQEQIDMISKKAAKATGILYSSRDKLNFEAKRTLYNTLILPHLQY